LQDKDLYLAAGDLVLEARYADALPSSSASKTVTFRRC